MWWSRHDYDRRVIRKFALGKFSQMLKASATHPAMMMYLNNAESTKDNPNENYGRELLELHSLGVDGGYDEEDMRQSTLVMTGFGISWDTGEFEYDKDNHFVGPVSVVDWSAANGSAKGGYDVGLRYVDHLAHHRRPRSGSRRSSTSASSRSSARASSTSSRRPTSVHGTDISAVLPRSSSGRRPSGHDRRQGPPSDEDLVATLRILG